MDEKLLVFMQENMITIGIAIAFLKVIAVETKSTLDDKIVTFFANMLSGFKKK